MMPMLGKEWRRLLRSPSLPWMLGLYVLVPAVVAGVYLQTAGRLPTGMMPQFVPLMGSQALSNVAAWQVLLLALWAPWLTAGTLASEVEERTLDTFLAGGGRMLSAVAGKLVAAWSLLGLAVLAGLPAFALPMLIGGVNVRLMGRVAALELATAVLMAGLGVLLSAFGRRSGGVAMAGVALGLMLTLGTALASGVAGSTSGFGGDPRISAMMGIPMGDMAKEGPKWLYGNPLVGLNSALDNGAPALVVVPGNWTMTVWKEYRLWQVQLVGAGVIGVVSGLMAWLAMLVRLRWRRPRLAWSRRKAVAVSGTEA
jgi:ABC-type transport system involved in multi-copper enzyme maturation permease subunit